MAFFGFLVLAPTAWQVAPVARPVVDPTCARARPILANVKQARQVQVGSKLPSIEAFGVEVVTDDCAFDDTCTLAETTDLLTTGKTVLVGMPGAFTPTCTDEHLPGFIRNAKEMRAAGVNNIAIVTTNDRFIMTAWKRKMRECASQAGLDTIDTEVSMLADKDGHLIRSLGLAYNEALDRKQKNAFIQLNSGIRSQRFALIVEDGVVQHVAIDDGTIELDKTSVDSILAILGPKPKPSPREPTPPVAVSTPPPAPTVAPTVASSVATSAAAEAAPVASSTSAEEDDDDKAAATAAIAIALAASAYYYYQTYGF